MSSDMIEETVVDDKSKKPAAKAATKKVASTDLGAVDLTPTSSATTASGLDVKIFKMFVKVPTPEYKTDEAACFDLSAYLGNDVQTLKGYSAKNFELAINVRENINDDERYILLQPGDRALIPTGLIFDLPAGSKMHIYPRSGTALKKGLNLANGVAVIDSDYTDQTFVLVTNNTGIRQRIDHGERIAQAEIVPSYRANISVSTKQPEQKGNRKGGFNSTGTK